jgi:hypothetical protein
MHRHRMSLEAVIPAVLLAATLARAQAPPSAKTLLDNAKTQAVANQRAIFVIFHASW